MKWLVWQVWVACVIAFVLGALVMWLIMSRRQRRQASPVLPQDVQPAADDTPTGRIPIQTVSTLDDSVAAPFGAGSARPHADGSAPSAEFTVKGNEESMLFHTTDSPYYSRTKAEVWFRTAADAEAAGFSAWNKRRSAARPT